MKLLLWVPLLLLSCIVGSNVLWDSNSRNKVDVFKPVYGVSTLFLAFFVLRPYLLMEGLVQSYVAFGEHALNRAILYGGVVSPFFFYAGYLLPFGKRIGYKIPYLCRDLSVHKLRVVMVACWLFSIVLSLLMTKNLVGGLSTAVMSPVTVQNTLLKKGGGYLSLGLSFAQSLFWIQFSLKLFRSKRISGFALLTSFLFALFFAYISGLRGNIIMLFGVAIGLWHYAKNKRISPIAISVLSPLFLFLVSALNLLRHSGSVNWELASDPQFVFSQMANVLGPFDSFVYILKAMDAGTLEPLYGIPYLGLLIAPIPRQIWPSKPIISVNILFTQLLGYDFMDRTFTVTMPGELHWHMPVVGVILGMMLWGIALRSAYQYRESHNDCSTTLFFLVFYLNSLNALRTSFFSWITSSALMLLPLGFLYSLTGSWCRKRG